MLILVPSYTSKKRYNISFAWNFKEKYGFSSDNGTVSRACDGPRLEPRPLPPPFVQNLRTSVSIGKKFEDCDIILACASLTTLDCIFPDTPFTYSISGKKSMYLTFLLKKKQKTRKLAFFTTQKSSLLAKIGSQIQIEKFCPSAHLEAPQIAFFLQERSNWANVYIWSD